MAKRHSSKYKRKKALGISGVGWVWNEPDTVRIHLLTRTRYIRTAIQVRRTASDEKDTTSVWKIGLVLHRRAGSYDSGLVSNRTYQLSSAAASPHVVAFFKNVCNSPHLLSYSPFPTRLAEASGVAREGSPPGCTGSDGHLPSSAGGIYSLRACRYFQVASEI